MAKLQHLIRAVSEGTGRPEPTVREIARQLQKAEMVKTGAVGRGRGAEMEVRDAAYLLLALLSGADVKHASANVLITAPLVIESYSNFIGTASLPAPPPAHFCGLGEGHTFLEALEALITETAKGGPPYPPLSFPYTAVRIEVDRPSPRGRVLVWCREFLWTAHYVHPSARETRRAKPSEVVQARRKKFGGGDYYETRGMGLTTLHAVARVFDADVDVNDTS